MTQLELADPVGAPVDRPATRVYAPDPAPAPEIPVKAPVAWVDHGMVVGCAISALALTVVGYTWLAGLPGKLGFGLCWYAVFALLVYVTFREARGRQAAVDKVVGTVVVTGAAALLVPLVHIIGFVLVKGLPELQPGFFVHDLRTTAALSDRGSGGAGHAILGTLEQVGLAVLIVVPLGIITAVFCNEVRGPLRRPVRMFVDTMSGVPSIVAGLFIYIVWVVGLNQHFSGFAASLALSVLMLPSIARTSEEILRLIPSGLREASLALGASQARTVWSVVLPTARSGLVTAAMLGVARGVGETAPLLMTSFGNKVLNANPFDGAQASLPKFVWDYFQAPNQALVDRAWTATLVLVALVLLLFTTARLIARRASPGRRRPRRKADA